MDDAERFAARFGARHPSPATTGPEHSRIAARMADEAAADRRRRVLRESGLAPIRPDDAVAAMLEPGEGVLAIRAGVAVDRRQPFPPRGAGVRGDLHVTTRRILHVGRPTLAFDLSEIREAVVAGDRLLLVIGEGLGLAVDVEDPRVLRVEISAARAAAAERAVA